MSDLDSMLNAFRKAVDIVGGQVAFANLVGVTQGAVSKRLKDRRPLQAENVLAVEEATGISRHDLRPDIYPREAGAAAGDDRIEGVRP